MCDKPRIYSTSFRYSEDVKNILDNVEGKTLADKIDFVCCDYIENKISRENEIKYLDSQILNKKKELESLSNKIYNMRDVSRYLENLISSIEKCNT